MTPAEELASKHQGKVIKTISGWLVSCIGHDDENPSCHLSDGETARS